jgi:hypothetical protein
MSDYEHEQPLVGAVGQPRLSARVPDSVRRVARWLALPWVAYLIAFAVSFGTYRYAYEQFQFQGPTGDEPSYVLDAMSMARDGDRDLSNQFSYIDTRPLVKLFGIPAVPHGQKLTNAGYILWHGAGLGFALVPGVWIGDAMGDPVTWMRYELMLLDALAAVALLGVLRKIGSALGIRSWIVWCTWASTALGLVLVAYADAFYPEVPALLCVLLALNALLARNPGWKTLAAGSLAAAYLPWLHVRFIPICFGLAGLLALRGLGVLNAPGTASRFLPTRDEARTWIRTLWSRAGVVSVAASIGPVIASLVFMAYKYDYWYGNPSWSGSAGVSTPTGVVSAAWYYNVLGGLFGTDYGFFPYVPVLLLAFAALGFVWVLAPRWVTAAVIIGMLYQYTLGTTTITTPGFVYPGRYEIVWIPLLSIALLVALSRIKVMWLAFAPLLFVSLWLSWQATQHGGTILLNTGTVQLPLAAHLQSAFPDIEFPGQPASFYVQQTTQIHTVGKVVGKGAAALAVATPKDGRGYLTAGPGVYLAPGTYTVQFNIRQTGAKGRTPFVRLEAWALPGYTLSSRTLTAADVPPGKNTVVDLPFASSGQLNVEARAYVYGRAAVALGAIGVNPTSTVPLPGVDEHPNAALMFLWIFGLFFVGAVLASLAYTQRALARLRLRPRV